MACIIDTHGGRLNPLRTTSLRTNALTAATIDPTQQSASSPVRPRPEGAERPGGECAYTSPRRVPGRSEIVSSPEAAGWGSGEGHVVAAYSGTSAAAGSNMPAGRASTDQRRQRSPVDLEDGEAFRRAWFQAEVGLFEFERV